jgi:hypothetical protein
LADSPSASLFYYTHSPASFDFARATDCISTPAFNSISNIALRSHRTIFCASLRSA